MHAYAGRPFRVEAVMANDGVRPPGDYPARFRIRGPEGGVCEKSVRLTVPSGEDPDGIPLALPVLCEDVIIDGPSGSYLLAAELEGGGAAAGGRQEFHLSRADELPRIDLTAAVVGMPEAARAWLASHGVACVKLRREEARSCRVILVGDGPVGSPETWREIARRMACGAGCVFLKPSAFAEGEDTTRRLPLEVKGKCEEARNWVYHREDVAVRHPIFDGLQAGGLLDWYYYLQATPRSLFRGLSVPDHTAAIAVRTDAPNDFYLSGLLAGAYRFGAGHFVLNTLQILENLGTNPAADRLLLNLVRYADGLATRSPEALPADFDARLRAIGYA